MGATTPATPLYDAHHAGFFFVGLEMAFSKPALTVDAQIDLLEKRGMLISDRGRAKHFLSHINYYRLRAYWLPFEEKEASDGEHALQAGTDFETVLAIYAFDRDLRLLLLDAIERVEISLRATFAQHLANRYGPFAHDMAELFKQADEWHKSQDELHKEYERSRETFAKHYRERYPELKTPPIWVVCELMTLGHLSRWVKNLRHPDDRQQIANQYGLDERVLLPFLHHLTVVRNHCAHHGRVWNRRFALRFSPPTKKPKHIAQNFNPNETQLIYNTLTLLVYLLDLLSPAHAWRAELLALLNKHPEINLAAMGFPTHWRKAHLWKSAP